MSVILILILILTYAVLACRLLIVCAPRARCADAVCVLVCLLLRSKTVGFHSKSLCFSINSPVYADRRAHVKAKGTLDSVEQKNYAVGEQKVGQPRRPTSCVLSFVEAEN